MKMATVTITASGKLDVESIQKRIAKAIQAKVKSPVFMRGVMDLFYNGSAEAKRYKRMYDAGLIRNSDINEMLQKISDDFAKKPTKTFMEDIDDVLEESGF